MGSTTTSYAVIALAVGLACLLAGFLWGRSNLKSKVEQVVEEGAASLDAREFAMRQQLDEAIAEIARLRPLAEELGRVQDRLKLEQSKYDGMKADFDAAMRGGTSEQAAEQEIAPQSPDPPPPPESADEAIQKLLQSLETLSPPDLQPDSTIVQVPEVFEPAPEREPVEMPDSPQVAAAPPEPSQLEPEPPQLIEPRPLPEPATKPLPAQAKTPVQTPQAKPDAVDEWQEFARSLAALTGRKN